MKELDIQNEIIDHSTGLDIIKTELNWILDRVNSHGKNPPEILVEEMLGKFYSLYGDFTKVRGKIEKLMASVLLLEENRFSKPESKWTYIQAVEDLNKKSLSEDFRKFISVAETGKLPKKT